MGEQMSERDELARRFMRSTPDHHPDLCDCDPEADAPCEGAYEHADAALAWFAEHRGPRVVSTAEELDTLVREQVAREIEAAMDQDAVRNGTHIVFDDVNRSGKRNAVLAIAARIARGEIRGATGGDPMSAQARAAEVLGAHGEGNFSNVNADLWCASCDVTIGPGDGSDADLDGLIAEHIARMLADAGLLAGEPPAPNLTVLLDNATPEQAEVIFGAAMDAAFDAAPDGVVVGGCSDLGCAQDGEPR